MVVFSHVSIILSIFTLGACGSKEARKENIAKPAPSPELSPAITISNGPSPSLSPEVPAPTPTLSASPEAANTIAPTQSLPPSPAPSDSPVAMPSPAPSPTPTPAPTTTPTMSPTQSLPAVLSPLPNRSLIPADANPASDWDFPSGSEYWLHSRRGSMMTYSASEKYAPYENAEACSGRTESPNSPCSLLPTKVARECQYRASLAATELLSNTPPALQELMDRFGGRLKYFGWLNDGFSDGAFATTPWQGPFIWRGDKTSIRVGQACPRDFVKLSGYLKWVASMDADYVCLTPSAGQLAALLAKAKECLELSQPQP